jgi:hypothetical protein
MHFVNRLNQKSAPVRVATDTGHGAYSRPPASRGDQPGWQLPVCPEPDPFHLAAILENARLKRLELDAIELDRLKRKRRPIGKSGVPPEAA